MNSVKVKICGITNLADAQAAERMGADYLGFIFAVKSKRYITAAKAKKIIQNLSASAKYVGVFVNESPENVNRIAKECGLDYAQIHNEVDEDYAQKIECGLIRVVRVKHAGDVAKASAYNRKDFILFDSMVEGYGGEGVGFDHGHLHGVSGDFFLAGGLSAENVGKAVREVAPYAVDVSSGVEESPGKKDHEKISKFINNAKNK